MREGKAEFRSGSLDVTPQLIKVLESYCETLNMSSAELLAENILLEAEKAELAKREQLVLQEVEECSRREEELWSRLAKLSNELKERGGRIGAKRLVLALARVQEWEHNDEFGFLEKHPHCSCAHCLTFVPFPNGVVRLDGSEQPTLVAS